MKNKIKPSYYKPGRHDAIAYATEHNLGINEFSILKYITRWKQKDGVDDLHKAKEYLNRLIVDNELTMGQIPKPMNKYSEPDDLDKDIRDHHSQLILDELKETIEESYREFIKDTHKLDEADMLASKEFEVEI